MADYDLLVKPSAVKELEAISKKGRQRIVGRILALAGMPRPPGCERLSGEDRCRLRPGRYRIVYQVNDPSMTVLVVKIGHRRDVYR